MRRALIALLGIALVLAMGGVSRGAERPPKAGAKCPKAGIVVTYNGTTFTCVKKGKKLIWVVSGTGGGGGGGGGGLVDQPVPADGKWLVEPGYPDDMPPRGWRGEPSWFISNWDIPTAQKIRFGRAHV